MGKSSLTLDHHVYDQLSDTWIKRCSKPQPVINLKVRALPEDHEALGFTFHGHTTAAVLPAMADTGCQSCLAGVKVIHRLGLRQSDLIPVNLRMHAANNKGIKILGATVLRLTGKGTQGEPVETRQLTYVTDTSDKLFISREACIALGIISATFPTVGETQEGHQHAMSATLQTDDGSVHSADSHSGLTAACTCPRRQGPPPPPTKLPFAALEDNRGKLEQYLLDYYKAHLILVITSPCP